jgi:hypothetical protein
MLPIREVLERHGRSCAIAEVAGDYMELINPGALASGLFEPGSSRRSKAKWIVEQDKPAGVERFFADLVGMPSPAELAICYRDPSVGGKALPRIVTIGADTVRLIGVSLVSDERPDTHVLNDE